MIGPEWVAQQKKLVASRMMNCGERNASPNDISAGGASLLDDAAGASSAGARRIRNETGIMIAATTTARICIDVRQSYCEISQAASGDMVIGAMPIPAETSDTARLRWVSNQPVTHAIIGAKMAAQAAPTTRPKTSWKARSEVARLASISPATSITEPASTARRGPQRSDRLPQTMEATAIVRKPMVMAPD